jgi:hypothetical protein
MLLSTYFLSTRILVAQVAIRKAQRWDAWFPIIHHITKEPVTENVNVDTVQYLRIALTVHVFWQSGLSPASKVQNQPSEVLMCLRYVGDYYKEFETLFG